MDHVLCGRGCGITCMSLRRDLLGTHCNYGLKVKDSYHGAELEQVQVNMVVLQGAGRD